MSDRFDVLERFAPMFDAPEPSFEGFLHRRDRKRRNQRIAAGVVGIAFFLAAVWIVTTGGPFDRTQTPAATGAVSVVPEVDYMIDLNTGVMTPLPDAIIRSLGGSVLSGSYAVSPNGSLLAYVGLGEDGNPQIFIAGIDGSGVRQVTHEPTGATSPGWSPDGTKIAYQDDAGHPAGGISHLFVLEVESGEATPLGLEGRDPQFTPDGSSLLYADAVRNVGVVSRAVLTVPVAGGKNTRLIGEGSLGVRSASLSPDGSLVTFLGYEPGRPTPQRWVANAHRTGTERWTIPGGVSVPSGTWSPDGNRIVCSGEEPVSNIILVVDVTTAEATRVAEGRAAIWLDDHTLLVEV